MLRIVNGRVYDPANGLDGVVKDLCVRDGRIVAEVPRDAKSIDARGMVIMPGGVDIHCHIAGTKVNLARKLQPEDHRQDVHLRTRITRSGTGGTVPSTFATGYTMPRWGTPPRWKPRCRRWAPGAPWSCHPVDRRRSV